MLFLAEDEVTTIRFCINLAWKSNIGEVVNFIYHHGKLQGVVKTREEITI